MKFTTAIAASVLFLGASAKLSESESDFAPVYGSLGKRASYPGCNAGQIADISRAAADAQNLIQSTLAYTGTVNADTPRYNRWFGAFEPGRRAKVMDTFSRMVNDPNSIITFYDCATPCNNAAAFAESDPARSYRIRLCSAFWSAPATGSVSKAGAIVRQLTTFTDNGGAQVFTSGRPAAVALAASNPSNAVQNADSYRFYAENTPFLA